MVGDRHGGPSVWPLLTDDRLEGPWTVERLLRPRLVAEVIDADDYSSALASVTRSCDMWGGAYSLLLPARRDESVLPRWSHLLRESLVDWTFTAGVVAAPEYGHGRGGGRWTDGDAHGDLTLSVLARAVPAGARPEVVTSRGVDPRDPWHLAYVAALGDLPERTAELPLELSELRAGLGYADLVEVVGVEGADWAGRPARPSPATVRDDRGDALVRTADHVRGALGTTVRRGARHAEPPTSRGGHRTERGRGLRARQRRGPRPVLASPRDPRPPRRLPARGSCNRGRARGARRVDPCVRVAALGPPGTRAGAGLRDRRRGEAGRPGASAVAGRGGGGRAAALVRSRPLVYGDGALRGRLRAACRVLTHRRRGPRSFDDAAARGSHAAHRDRPRPAPPRQPDHADRVARHPVQPGCRRGRVHPTADDDGPLPNGSRRARRGRAGPRDARTPQRPVSRPNTS